MAVEAHAMNMATEFYSTAWDVQDVHGTESYDLICRRGNEVKHVEVKGTTTDGEEVILTPNEVRHAQENPCTALFVVSNIKVERAEDGTVTATGGKHHCYDPWRLRRRNADPRRFPLSGTSRAGPGTLIGRPAGQEPEMCTDLCTRRARVRPGGERANLAVWLRARPLAE